MATDILDMKEIVLHIIKVHLEMNTTNHTKDEMIWMSIIITNLLTNSLTNLIKYFDNIFISLYFLFDF